LHIIDAPTQRLYAFGFYVALLAWKLYNWAQLVEEDTESFWLFLKWVAIDCAFLFGLPELRIPWLELSQPTVVVAFFLHALFDWILMFNLGVRLSCYPSSVLRGTVANTISVSLARVGPRLC
jgi:nucleoporin POM152